MAQKPGASIPTVCRNWSETVVAYRLLARWDEVMQAHWQASEQRIGQHPVVLCLQDTTELDFNGQQMAGLGPLSYEAQRGLYLHPTYVVTAGIDQRVDLGAPVQVGRRHARGSAGEHALDREL